MIERAYVAGVANKTHMMVGHDRDEEEGPSSE